jgi:hypothetical protein
MVNVKNPTKMIRTEYPEVIPVGERIGRNPAISATVVFQYSSQVRLPAKYS